jgi:hypothetical protein
MKTRALVLIAWISASNALLLAAIRSESNQQPESPAPASASTDQKPVPTGKRLSAGIADILKMTERGVDSSVIKSFVENYPVAYHPSADEVIALHDAGISSDIIAALLRRTGELRTKQIQARKASGPVEAPQSSVQIVAPQQTVPAPQVNYVYPSYGYPSYGYTTYPAYSYSYALPWYYSSAYSYWPYRYYSHYSYRPRSSCWPSWPSWPSYGGNVGYRSGYCARPAAGFHSYPRHSSHFVRR